MPALLTAAARKARISPACPLPLKVTVDFENTVVASVDDTGYAPDNFDSAANSADQMVVHGIDGPFTWQWPSTMRAQPRRSRLLLPIA
jgi:hypothetical protein